MFERGHPVGTNQTVLIARAFDDLGFEVLQPGIGRDLFHPVRGHDRRVG